MKRAGGKATVDRFGAPFNGLWNDRSLSLAKKQVAEEK
jgi:hypothetical protein